MDGGLVNTVAMEGGKELLMTDLNCHRLFRSSLLLGLSAFHHEGHSGSALPETVLLLIEDAGVVKVSHEVASNYVLK